MDEYSREPCPWRILDDSGGAFLMGAIGGGIFHSIKGFRNAPIGFSRKMVCPCYCTYFKLSEDICTCLNNEISFLAWKFSSNERALSNSRW